MPLMKMSIQMDEALSLIYYNRLVHRLLGFAPIISLMVLFCTVNAGILYCQMNYCKNFSMFHYGLNVRKLKCFQYVNVTDVQCRTR